MMDASRIDNWGQLLARSALAFRRRPSPGRIRRFIALALAAGLSACALATDAPPTVDVLSVRLIGLGLIEQQIETTLCVTNPNANEIAFRRVAVSLDLSGLPLASGTSDLPVRLPPASSTAVPFTGLTTLRNIGPQVLGILQSGSLAYRIHGTVSLDGVLGLTLPFVRSGRLNLLDGGLTLASSATEATPSRCSSTVTQIRPRL